MIPIDNETNLDIFAHFRYIGGFYAYVPFFFSRGASPNSLYKFNLTGTGHEGCRGSNLAEVHVQQNGLGTSHLKKRVDTVNTLRYGSIIGKDKTYSVIDDACAHQETLEHEDALVAPPLSGYALPANGLSMSGLDLLLLYYFIIHMP